MILYLLDSLASGSNHMAFQVDGSAPSAARITTGWVVSNSAPTLYARLDSQTERAANQHTSTVQPSGAPDNTLGDSFRTPSTLNGSFASANWSFSFEVQGETRATSTHDGRLRIRVWRSVNADGSSATEITGATQTTSGYTDLSNSVKQTLTLTFNPGAFSLTNEYLFVQIAHELTGAGNNNNSDTHLCVGPSNTVTTSTFSTNVALDLQAIGIAQPALVAAEQISLDVQAIGVAQPAIVAAEQIDLGVQAIGIDQPALTAFEQIQLDVQAIGLAQPALIAAEQISLDVQAIGIDQPALTAFEQVELGAQAIGIDQPALAALEQIELDAQAIGIEQPGLLAFMLIELGLQAIGIEQPSLSVTSGESFSAVRWAKTSGYITDRKRHSRRIVLN